VGGAADGPAGVRGGPCSAGPAACSAADGFILRLIYDVS